jgi:hypothetical protein
MRFFRGIAVRPDQAAEIRQKILGCGLGEGDGWWDMRLRRPPNRIALFSKDNLTTEDTRSDELEELPFVCACGEFNGAAYYACSHNWSEQNNVPLIIEFDVDARSVALDGRDFLYRAFQGGRPEIARPVLVDCFGPNILQYVDRAWRSDDQQFRIAMCDLAIQDPAVINDHYRNTRVIAGRHKTVFRNAFLIQLPVPASAIISVRTDVTFEFPVIDYTLDDIG